MLGFDAISEDPISALPEESAPPPPPTPPFFPPPFLSQYGGGGMGVQGGFPDSDDVERIGRDVRFERVEIEVVPARVVTPWLKHPLALPVAGVVVGAVVAWLRAPPKADDFEPEVEVRRNPEPVYEAPAPSPTPTPSTPRRKALDRLPVAKNAPSTRACLVCDVVYPLLSFELVPGYPRSKICTKCLDAGEMRVYVRKCAECGTTFESPSSRAIVCEECKPVRDARLAAARQRKRRSGHRPTGRKK